MFGGWEWPLSVSFAERGCDWDCEVGMCSKVLLFGRHTWCGKRCGGSGKSYSEMCLGKVQGVISYPDGPDGYASYRIKGKIYKACVQSALTYGTETWAMKKANLQSLERTEQMMVRWMCGVSLKYRKRSVDLYSLLGVQRVDEVWSGVDWGGLGMWNVRVGMIGCRPVEMWWWQG